MKKRIFIVDHRAAQYTTERSTWGTFGDHERTLVIDRAVLSSEYSAVKPATGKIAIASVRSPRLTIAKSPA